MSEDEYTRKYDLDLVKETHGDFGDHKVITISKIYDEEIENTQIIIGT